MGRSRDGEMVSRVAEDALWMLSEAEDFLDRVETITHDLLAEVASGKGDLGEAHLTVRLEFSSALKDLRDWERRLAPDAWAAGFPHLHESLRPQFRIVLPLPLQGGDTA